jgi:hypothetical protein
MKTFLSIIFTIASLSTFAQSQTTGFNANEKDKNQKILEQGKNYDVNFDIDNHDAFFLAGEQALFMEIYKNLNIPQSAIDDALDAVAMISFKVGFNGKVLDPSSISKVGHGLDEQIHEILRGLEFVPATQGGTAYRSEVVIEVPVKARYISETFKK